MDSTEGTPSTLNPVEQLPVEGQRIVVTFHHYDGDREYHGTYRKGGIYNDRGSKMIRWRPGRLIGWKP